MEPTLLFELPTRCEYWSWKRVKKFLDVYGMEKSASLMDAVLVPKISMVTFCVSNGHWHRIHLRIPCFPSSSVRVIMCMVLQEANISRMLRIIRTR